MWGTASFGSQPDQHMARNIERCVSLLEDLGGRVGSIEARLGSAGATKPPGLGEGMPLPSMAAGTGVDSTSPSGVLLPAALPAASTTSESLHRQSPRSKPIAPPSPRAGQKDSAGYTSLWLQDYAEFEALMQDEARIDQLVRHLNATQLRFESESDSSWHLGKRMSFSHRPREAARPSTCCGLIATRWRHWLALGKRLGHALLAPGAACARQSGRLLEAACKRLIRAPDGSAGRVRTAWDAMQTALLLSSAVLVPLRLGFPSLFPLGAFDAAEVACDAILGLDVGVSLLTPFYKEQRSLLVQDPRRVLQHNMLRWLLLDVLAALPVAAILAAFRAPHMGTQPTSPVSLQLLPLLRVLQISRVLKAVFRTSTSLRATRLAKRLSRRTNGSVVFLVVLLLTIVLVWHWIACIWWFIVTSDGSGASGKQEGWWFVMVGQSADPAVIDAASFGAASPAIYAYCVAVHWVVQISIGVGAPLVVQSGWQACIENITSCIGVVMQTLFFGAAAAAINHQDEMRRRRQRKLESVRAFIRQRNVPPFVAARVLNFYEYMATRMQPTEEVKLLEELPSTLRLQLAVVLNQGYLLRLPMFQMADSRSVALLALALVQRTYLPYELVLSEGALNDSLHFVRTGTLQVFVRLQGVPPPNNRRPSVANEDANALQAVRASEEEQQRPRTVLQLARSLVTRPEPSDRGGGGSKQPGLPIRQWSVRRRMRRQATWSAPENSFGKPARGRAKASEGQTVTGSLGTLVGTLREGAAFGEQSFLNPQIKSKASIRTSEYSICMSLHRSYLEAIFDRNDGLRRHVELFMEQQQQKYAQTNSDAAAKLEKRRRNENARASISGAIEGVLNNLRDSKKRSMSVRVGVRSPSPAGRNVSPLGVRRPEPRHTTAV